MNKMRMLVYLENGFAAFSAGEALLAEIGARFPQIEIDQVKTEEEFSEHLPTADFVATWSFPAEHYSKAGRLRAVFTPAAGREKVAADPRGKAAVFYGSYHGVLMAETLLGLILFFNRQLKRVLENQGKGVWDRGFLATTPRLGSQHVVIVGFGHIGRECAKVLRPFGCRITGVKRSPRDEKLDGGADKIVTIAELEKVLPDADHVVVILPSDSGTDRIITRKHFQSMKRSAHFYNFGRGNCYAEEDLIWALRERLIAGAGLDVYAEEPLPKSSGLWSLPNVVLLPHASPLYPDYMVLFMREMLDRLEPLVAALK